MKDISYKVLASDEINVSLFDSFDRYQEVTRCWRKRDGEWRIEDVVFTERWDPRDFESTTIALKQTAESGGAVIAAFSESRMIGFVSVESQRFGEDSQYVNLPYLHISHDSRGLGIGRELFIQACNSDRRFGVSKLYISAHSSVESQAFYRAVGCVEAAEYNKTLADSEPCDVQMEYVL